MSRGMEIIINTDLEISQRACSSQTKRKVKKQPKANSFSEKLITGLVLQATTSIERTKMQSSSFTVLHIESLVRLKAFAGTFKAAIRERIIPRVERFIAMSAIVIVIRFFSIKSGKNGVFKTCRKNAFIPSEIIE